jgi:serine/threonine protein phosphatase 1
MPARTIAIGNIHGCSAALDALINAIRPRPEDAIVTLGDYINRGPDSRDVLNRLIDLGRRCRLVPILGNHEEMLLDVRSGKYPIGWLLDMGSTATLDSYGPGRDLGLIHDGHYEFLEGCLGFHETETHVFVHANYFPDIPMAEQPVGMLRWEPLRDTTPARASRAGRSSSATPRRRAARSSTSATSCASTPTATGAAGSRRWT